LSVGGEVGSGQPRDKSRRPPPLFIAQGDRGPPAMVGWAPPIRARIKGPTGPLGPVRIRDQSNNLPLDLFPSFTFISFTFVHSITD